LIFDVTAVTDAGVDATVVMAEGEIIGNDISTSGLEFAEQAAVLDSEWVAVVADASQQQAFMKSTKQHEV
jgi:hypothetical protein